MTAESVLVPPADVTGDLTVPVDARGLVLFAHGSGSSRKSSRNRFVAGLLQQNGFATMLMDLLTAEEEMVDIRTSHLRFGIPLLADRLASATEFLKRDERTARLPIGYFGASTGAAAALVAAARNPENVHAVVSRGGRPDLAGDSLPLVRTPVQLIVGSDDREVLALNREALAEIGSENKRLDIVAGATHLFEEPGTLEQAAQLAIAWFGRYLVPLAS
jgi:putative phosphoribosyl transferase